MTTFLSLSTVARNAMLDDLRARVAGGTIEIRTGAKPASPDDTATGTLLATFTLPSPAFDAAAGGVITMDTDPILTATAAAAGDPGWGRIKSSAGVAVIDGDAGPSDAVFVVSPAALLAGQTVELTVGTINL